MSHDLLDSAARAFFDATQANTRNGELVRQRVLRTLHVRQKRLKILLVWWVPALTLAISSIALAAAGRPLVARVVRLLVSESHSGMANHVAARHNAFAKVAFATLPGPKVATSVSLSRLTAHPCQMTGVAASVISHASPVGVRIAPGRGAASQASERDGQVAKTASKHSDTLNEGRDLVLFRNAQRLHTSGQAPIAALQAWELYLAEFPSGALAPEAQFNRAICLIRVGRMGEARDVLEPFARGQLGGYRAQQANDLLRALRR